MHILFDQGTPVPLRESLAHHEVTTAFERGWSQPKNGELLRAAEKESFEVLVTADRDLKYQQNPKSHSIAIVVLSTPSWPRITRALNTVIRAVDAATSRSHVEVDIP